MSGETTVVTTTPSYVPPVPSSSIGGTVSTFTHSVGIITPPHEIALIIDRTAEFVKKLGEAFEQEIKNRDGTKKKFAFLFPASPYHAYYRARVQYGADIPPELMSQEILPPTIAAPAPTAPVDEKPAEPPKPITLQDRLRAEIQKSNIHHIVHESSSITVPEEQEIRKNIYTVKPPEIYSPLDIEILKLTALYGARNGKTFLDGLKLRERFNRQFSFLQPNNLLHTLWQQYHDAYLAVMIPPPGMITTLREHVEKGDAVLHQWLEKAKIEKVVRAKNAKQAVDEDTEAEIMSAIDWHNFVIVETITFEAADESFLPQPKNTVEEMLAMLTDTGEVEEAAQDMDMDMDDEMEEENIAAAAAMAEKQKQVADAMAAAKQKYQIGDEELEIRRDYNESRVRELADKGVKFQKCPVCGDEIAIEDLSEHIRIELLDPRWKEQKQLLLDKQRESSYAPDNTIVQNLARLAKKRQAQNALGETTDDNKDQDKFDLAKLTAAQHEKEKERLAKEQQAAAKAAPKVQPPVAPRVAAPIAPVAPPVAPRVVAAPMPPVRPPAPIAPVTLPPAFPFPPVAVPVPVPVPPTVLPPRPPAPPAQPPIPAPPSQPAPPSASATSEPPAKKPRIAPPPAPAPPPVEKKLSSEDEWLASHPGPCTVHISIPSDPDQSKHNFNGQTFDVTTPSLTSSVLSMKEQIVTHLNGLGANKIKLQVQNGVFLAKDNQSLASYNVANGMTLVVGLKERGGKSKK